MRTPHATRSGFSMIEATLASLLIGSVIASTMGVIGPVLRTSELAEQQIIAERLCDELIAEILLEPIRDPDDGSDVDAIGVDKSERSGIRADFDDVDDYHGWVSLPPQYKGGTNYTIGVSWARQVTVQHLSARDLKTISATDTGIKRIRVVVVKKGTQLAERTVIRTESWDNARSASIAAAGER